MKLKSRLSSIPYEIWIGALGTAKKVTRVQVVPSQYSSKVKSMCQGIQLDPSWLKRHGKSRHSRSCEPGAKKSSLLRNENAQRPKKVRVWASGVHDYNYTTKASLESPKEGNWNDQTKEGNETVEPTQARLAFEEGGKLAKTSFKKLISVEEP